MKNTRTELGNSVFTFYVHLSGLLHIVLEYGFRTLFKRRESEKGNSVLLIPGSYLNGFSVSVVNAVLL